MHHYPAIGDQFNKIKVLRVVFQTYLISSRGDIGFEDNPAINGDHPQSTWRKRFQINLSIVRVWKNLQLEISIFPKPNT